MTRLKLFQRPTELDLESEWQGISTSQHHNNIPGKNYVILPLYSTRGFRREIPPKSGLNQWNAAGRRRDPNEVYIPIPAQIRSNSSEFFPPQNEHFTLRLPDGRSLSVKVCQDNSKALMSTHNADLGQ